MPLPQAFFARDARLVARELLGKKLIRRLAGHTLSGLVVETEAYLGTEDSASHAYRGPTPRNAVMFGQAGIAYVYFIYGMYHMLNVVTEDVGRAGAVLLRALEPLQGQNHMASQRGKHGLGISNGPAKLCQALAIDREFNRWDLTQGDILWLESHLAVPSDQVRTGPRVRITYATPADQRAPWRFWINTNRYVSR